MNERVGRVDAIKGETVKDGNDLQGRYPGGERMNTYKGKSWLEEMNTDSSNHPAQASQKIQSPSKVELESSTLLGSMLLGMMASRGDEESYSSE
jgi:hypothetical protein